MRSGRSARRLFPAAGLLLAFFATAVAVRAWLGERSYAAGKAAQRRGDFNAAAAAYRAASGRGSADAAIERARLELLRRDWVAAGESLREALAIAPMRGAPHLLRATLEIDRPGSWDNAREERVLASCRRATALEPARGSTWSASAGAMLKLVVLRRALWDPAHTRTVLAEAADGYAAALARDPGSARELFARILDDGGDPVFLFDVASRGTAAGLPTLVGLLYDRGVWAGAEPGLWTAAEERGLLPAYGAAVADVLTRRGKIREALTAVRQGRLAAPGDVALAIREADISARLPGREALAAVPLYRAAVAAEPSNLAVRRRFAGFLAARELFGEAEREAHEIVGADPKDAESWFLLGEIMRRSGRADEAGVPYRNAADLRPKNEAYRRAAAGSRR